MGVEHENARQLHHLRNCLEIIRDVLEATLADLDGAQGTEAQNSDGDSVAISAAGLTAAEFAAAAGSDFVKTAVETFGGELQPSGTPLKPHATLEQLKAAWDAVPVEQGHKLREWLKDRKIEKASDLPEQHRWALIDYCETLK